MAHKTTSIMSLIVGLFIIGCGSLGGSDSGGDDINKNHFVIEVSSNYSRSEGCEAKTHHLIDKSRSIFGGGACGQRGINIHVITNEGESVAVRSFDTWSSSSAQTELIAFLETLTGGQIVLASVTDEGSSRLSPASRSRIAEILGSEEIEYLGYRQGWALITIIGGATLSEDRSTGNAIATATCDRGVCS